MIFVFLADGFEEIEALTVVDVLRRAGIETLTVGVSDETIIGAHNIAVESDILVDEVDFSHIKGVVLPGGIPGADNLFANESVKSAVQTAFDNGALVSAICAAPAILGKMGILKDKRATCYPGYEKELEGAKFENAKVVTDGNVITAKGAGVSLDFALEIVKYFQGEEVAKKIRASMQK